MQGNGIMMLACCITGFHNRASGKGAFHWKFAFLLQNACQTTGHGSFTVSLIEAVVRLVQVCMWMTTLSSGHLLIADP
jgi:hypothetical protein